MEQILWGHGRLAVWLHQARESWLHLFCGTCMMVSGIPEIFAFELEYFKSKLPCKTKFKLTFTTKSQKGHGGRFLPTLNTYTPNAFSWHFLRERGWAVLWYSIMCVNPLLVVAHYSMCSWLKNKVMQCMLECLFLFVLQHFRKPLKHLSEGTTAKI